MRTHTNLEFEGELQQLKDQLLAMAARCEQMIASAVRAFEEQDGELAREVIATDAEVNRAELDVDDLAVRILALRQPVGRDLRFTVAVVKVVTDLERIGDLAVNIAERADEMSTKTSLPEPHADLPRMGAVASEMLKSALDAFVKEDVEGARAVLARDDEVDRIHAECLKKCLEFIKSKPEWAHGGVRVLSCAKYLERIADHATNIAEMIIYLVEGLDIRHHGKLETDASGLDANAPTG